MTRTKLTVVLAALTLLGIAAPLHAATLTFDNGGAGWFFDENNPVEFGFSFDESLLEIESITATMYHTFSGSVQFYVLGESGAFYDLMGQQGGSTDLGDPSNGIGFTYTFVASGGAAAGTYAAGGAGTYDANSWTAGSFPGGSAVGWAWNFVTPFTDDSGFIDSVVIDYNAVPVPAPTTLALIGLGLVGMAATRRRRKV